jgi:hypothetical protein
MFGGAAPGPGRPAAEQFLDSVNRIEQLQNGVQVRVVTHAWMDPDFWERVDRLMSRKTRRAAPVCCPRRVPDLDRRVENDCRSARCRCEGERGGGSGNAALKRSPPPENKVTATVPRWLHHLRSEDARSHPPPSRSDQAVPRRSL